MLVRSTLLPVLLRVTITTYRGNAAGGDGEGARVVRGVTDIGTQVHVMDDLLIVRAALDGVVVDGHVVSVLDSVLGRHAVVVGMVKMNRWCGG